MVVDKQIRSLRESRDKVSNAEGIVAAEGTYCNEPLDSCAFEVADLRATQWAADLPIICLGVVPSTPSASRSGERNAVDMHGLLWLYLDRQLHVIARSGFGLL